MWLSAPVRLSAGLAGLILALSARPLGGEGGGQLCWLLGPSAAGPLGQLPGPLKAVTLLSSTWPLRLCSPGPPPLLPPGPRVSLPSPRFSLHTRPGSSSLATAAAFPPVSPLCLEPRLTPPSPCRLPARWRPCQPGCFPRASHDSPARWTLGATGQMSPSAHVSSLGRIATTLLPPHSDHPRPQSSAPRACLHPQRRLFEHVDISSAPWKPRTTVAGRTDSLTYPPTVRPLPCGSQPQPVASQNG